MTNKEFMDADFDDDGIPNKKDKYPFNPVNYRYKIEFAKQYPSIDLKKYSGKWYQIAGIPSWFQSGCKNSTAVYEVLPDGNVKVTNNCVRGGVKSSVSATAKSVSKDNRKLEVSFFPFFKGDYNIIFTDYKNSLVGSSSKKYLWILSREKKISQGDYDKLVGIAKSKGYDISKLERE